VPLAAFKVKFLRALLYSPHNDYTMSFGASTIGVAAAAVGDAGVGVAIAMAIGGGLGGCLSSSAFTSLEITTTASTMQATGIAAIPARAKGKMQHKLQQPKLSNLWTVQSSTLGV
jgi:hypothetical protein